MKGAPAKPMRGVPPSSAVSRRTDSAMSGTSSGVLPVVVHKSLPAEVKDLKSFIEYAKKNKVNFGSWALGSSAHIFAQTLNEKYGLTIEVVTYKGEAPMWQDMGAGQLQAAMGSPQAMNALAVKGDVRGIAAPSKVRARIFPDVPTSQEQGFMDDAFTVSGWLALAAPAATPKDIVKKLSDTLFEAGTDEKVKALMANYLIVGPLDFEATNNVFKRDTEIMLKVMKEIGIKAE